MSIGIRRTATSHKEEDTQVSDCRVRTETVKGEEGICKGKPVSGRMCVILGAILVPIFGIPYYLISVRTCRNVYLNYVVVVM
jgi:hypothetical protein